LSCEFHAAAWEFQALEKPGNEPSVLIDESPSTEEVNSTDLNPLSKRALLEEPSFSSKQPYPLKKKHQSALFPNPTPGPNSDLKDLSSTILTAPLR